MKKCGSLEVRGPPRSSPT